MQKIDWEKSNIMFIANEFLEYSDYPSEKERRKKIEPWLTAVFQSEHLSLLCGTGLTTGVCKNAGFEPQAMGRIEFTTEKDKIKAYADAEAERLNRGVANFEDDLRTALELLKGYRVLEHPDAQKLSDEINSYLTELIDNLIKNETNLLGAEEKGKSALALLKRFLISFASRTATRDRLHIFTTNYDRLVEYALDSAGIYILDRFIGKLNPTMRMHKMELDYHYNPPGIRGEPRYVEGVVRFTKLHGSVDWRFQEGDIQRIPIPFGAIPNRADERPVDTIVVYPNSSKGIDTAYFPYSELFRDFSTAICRPNSVLVTYGYGFGDSHINNIISDMLNIPSTHLVIISYDTANGRIPNFIEKVNQSQLTLLIGKDVGEIRSLSENYLPKSAIDRISVRQHELLERRGDQNGKNHNKSKPSEVVFDSGESS